MTEYALLPEPERRLIVEQVAARMGILPVIVEMDFWVCWILHRIFETPEMGPDVVFKGGTSLAKVFGAIQRFSATTRRKANGGTLGSAYPASAGLWLGTRKP